MILLTNCVQVLQELLAPFGSASQNLFAFLQYEPNPVAIIEHVLRLPRQSVYITRQTFCDGSAVYEALEAMLNLLKKLDEDMRTNPPATLLAEVVRSTYDRSVNLSDLFYKYFDYVVTRIPLSRITSHRRAKLVLIDPSPDELLDVDRVLELSNGGHVKDRLDNVRKYIAKLYARHDSPLEGPSLVSYLRFLAARYGHVEVNAGDRTLTVAGVTLRPPTVADFERTVDALGMHLQYYGKAPAIEVKLPSMFLRKARLTVNVLYTDEGIRILAPPNALGQLLHENPECPTTYLLVKAGKSEGSCTIADVYLLHVNSYGLADAVKVLLVEASCRSDDVACLLTEVGKAVRRFSPMLIVYRLIRELLRRGYAVRLASTKEYSYLFRSRYDVIGVRAVRLDESAYRSLSFFYSTNDDVFYLQSILSSYSVDGDEFFTRLYIDVSEPRYEVAHGYIDELKKVIEKVAANLKLSCQDVYSTLNGVAVEMCLCDPNHVPRVVDYIEKLYGLYQNFVQDKLRSLEKLDKREAVVAYLAAVSATYYDKQGKLQDAFKVIETHVKVPVGLLADVCNSYLKPLGAPIRSVHDFASAVDVLQKLFGRGLVTLDDDGHFTVLGLRPDHVFAKYSLPFRTEPFDMFVLRSLLAVASLSDVTSGKRVPLRLVELLLDDRFAATDRDKQVQVNALLEVAGDPELWRSLPATLKNRVFAVGGKRLVLHAALNGYTWLFEGKPLEQLLRMVETPDERTAVLAAALGLANRIYTYKEHVYLKVNNIVLQACSSSGNEVTFRGSVLGYPVGIVVKASSVDEAVNKVASDMLDTYMEFKELLEEQHNLQVEYEDAGLFKVPVIVVNTARGSDRIYLEKGIKEKLKKLSIE